MMAPGPNGAAGLMRKSRSSRADDRAIMSTIEIHPPSAAWPGDFLALKARLVDVMPTGSLIHHIGSTAVPGLAAKDVIDIQVSVDRLDQVDPAAVVALGFKQREMSGIGDHCPPGMELPDAELTKLFFKSTGRAANVHVRERGRFNQRYALLCRDFLRSHPVAAQAYVLVKQNLVKHVGDDEGAYYDIKDPVFDIIVDGANEWAMRVGWTEPPGD
jgi:GrpB-like predicted nucleotidyltransferase (UPF0157 family)